MTAISDKPLWNWINFQFEVFGSTSAYVADQPSRVPVKPTFCGRSAWARILATSFALDPAESAVAFNLDQGLGAAEGAI
ncbi:hypothetical protein [Microvirga aerophila]|uniref:hypothetical protein n=1 Tax=Microvirga aerophila TaxID=670291 RepID=UPI0011BE0DFB|nr:hypothetical protein [Microvirga aerophila]